MDLVLTPTSSVRGQVFLADGERAGAGAQVTLKPVESGATMQAVTKSDGTYEFTLVPPKGFTVSVYDPATGNFGMARGSVETGDEAVVDLHILGRGTVTARVIDGGGNPVAGARVRLDSGSPVADLVGDFPEATTDQQGQAVFGDVPEGDFSVTAEDSRTLTGGRSGGTISEDLSEVSVTIVVAPSGAVAGTVRTADGTGVVPYARVTLSAAGRLSLLHDH